MPPPSFQKWRQFSVFEQSTFKIDDSSTFLSEADGRSPWAPPKTQCFLMVLLRPKTESGELSRASGRTQDALSKSILFTRFAALCLHFIIIKSMFCSKTTVFIYVFEAFWSKSWFSQVNHLLIFHRFRDFHHSKTIGFSCFADQTLQKPMVF